MMSNEWVTMVDSSQYGEIPEIEQLVVNPTSVSACYKVLISLKLPVVNRSLFKWETDLGEQLSHDWSTICLNYKCMVEVKLCSFYLCFINRCFHFNAARVHYTLGLLLYVPCVMNITKYLCMFSGTVLKFSLCG